MEIKILPSSVNEAQIHHHEKMGKMGGIENLWLESVAMANVYRTIWSELGCGGERGSLGRVICGLKHVYASRDQHK
jgi:hypothetical protein